MAQLCAINMGLCVKQTETNSDRINKGTCGLFNTTVIKLVATSNPTNYLMGGAVVSPSQSLHSQGCHFPPVDPPAASLFWSLSITGKIWGVLPVFASGLTICCLKSDS